MNNKKILAIMFMSIFLISLVSALTFKQNEQADIKIVCINAGYCTASAICNASVFDPDNIVILDGVQATQSPSLAYFNITLNSTQTTKLGQYTVGGFCKDGSVTQLIDFNFEVNTTGNELELPESLVNIFLILFFIGLLVGTHHIAKKTDFKKWNEQIIKKYKEKNMVKMILSSILYNFMKNTYMIYFLIGLPIIMLVTDITNVYNIVGFIAFMNSLLLIYTVGIIIVGLVFLSYVQEWIMDMIELVKNLDWGVS